MMLVGDARSFDIDRAIGESLQDQSVEKQRQALSGRCANVSPCSSCINELTKSRERVLKMNSSNTRTCARFMKIAVLFVQFGSESNGLE